MKKQEENQTGRAKEITEKEFEILEFNLFISSAGKEHLEKAAKDTEAIKKKVRQGKIDLTKYQKLAEEF